MGFDGFSCAKQVGKWASHVKPSFPCNFPLKNVNKEGARKRVLFILTILTWVDFIGTTGRDRARGGSGFFLDPGVGVSETPKFTGGFSVSLTPGPLPGVLDGHANQVGPSLCPVTMSHTPAFYGLGMEQDRGGGARLERGGVKFIFTVSARTYECRITGGQPCTKKGSKRHCSEFITLGLLCHG